MSAHIQPLETDAIGVFPNLLLWMVIVIAILGVLAHVATA
jgi:hypothetical protein